VANGVLVGIIVGGYLMSGFLHPFRPCRSCSGTGVHKGAVFRRATRNCAAAAARAGSAAPVPHEGRAFGERR
jgi:hypothetical protein